MQNTIKQVTLATKQADDKLAAYLNAKERSAAAQANYTAAQQALASSIYEIVRSTFIRSKCYLTYRNSFVAIKVCKPTASDKLAAAQLEEQLAAANVVRAVTAQGYVYRLTV